MAEGGELCQKIAAFNNRVSDLGIRAWEGGVAEAALVEGGERLMTGALRAILAGQEEVHSKLPKVAKGNSGSRRNTRPAQRM